jgi:hypothetical protein
MGVDTGSGARLPPQSERDRHASPAYARMLEQLRQQTGRTTPYTAGGARGWWQGLSQPRNDYFSAAGGRRSGAMGSGGGGGGRGGGGRGGGGGGGAGGGMSQSALDQAIALLQGGMAGPQLTGYGTAPQLNLQGYSQFRGQNINPFQAAMYNQLQQQLGQAVKTDTANVNQINQQTLAQLQQNYQNPYQQLLGGGPIQGGGPPQVGLPGGKQPPGQMPPGGPVATPGGPNMGIAVGEPNPGAPAAPPAGAVPAAPAPSTEGAGLVDPGALQAGAAQQQVENQNSLGAFQGLLGVLAGASDQSQASRVHQLGLDRQTALNQIGAQKTGLGASIGMAKNQAYQDWLRRDEERRNQNSIMGQDVARQNVDIRNQANQANWQNRNDYQRGNIDIRNQQATAGTSQRNQVLQPLLDLIAGTAGTTLNLDALKKLIASMGGGR